MTRQARLARPVASVDCVDIVPTVFLPERYKAMDVYGWVVHIGPGCTREKDRRWFRWARSQADCLRLAYGGAWWRIDFLGAMGADADHGFYLLTHHAAGWRLLVRVPRRRDAADSWASMPDVACGRIGADADAATNTVVDADAAKVLMEARRTWFADTLQHNTVGADSMVALVDEVATLARKPTFAEAFANPRPRGIGLHPAAPAWAWDEHVTADLTRTLVEVWLAEQGYAGADASAVRTMVALGGEQALNAYARAAA